MNNIKHGIRANRILVADSARCCLRQLRRLGLNVIFTRYWSLELSSLTARRSGSVTPILQHTQQPTGSAAGRLPGTTPSCIPLHGRTSRLARCSQASNCLFTSSRRAQVQPC